MTKPKLNAEQRFSRVKAFAAVSLAALSLATLGTAGMARADSLKDAVAMAYAQNPSLVRSRAQQRSTDETYVQARSSLGPGLGAAATTDYTDYPSSASGKRSTTTLGLSLNQTLFASGGLSSQLDAAKSTVLSGQQSLRSAESSLMLNVISVYTAVRRDQEALQISQANYDILKKQLDQTQAQFEAGQLTRTDVSQSQARLSASEAGLASAQAELDTDRADYVAIVGQSPTALDPTPDLPGLPADFNAALASAEKNNPDLQAALYAEDAAKSRLTEARSAFGPRVSVAATSGEAAPSEHLSALSHAEATQATLTVSIPLFSAGLNGSRVRQALEDYTAQKATTDLAHRQVVSSISQAWSQMLAARSAVASNQAQVAAAQVAADGIKTEQQVGLRTNIEVLNAEQDLKSAQLSLVEAQRNQYVSASQLLSAMGILTAKNLVPDIDVYDPQKNFNKVKSKGWTPIEPVVHAVDGLASSALGGKK